MAESEIRAKLTLDTSQAGAQMQQFKQKAAWNPELRAPGEKVVMTGEYATASQHEAIRVAKLRQRQQDLWWASVEKKWSPEQQELRRAEATWLKSKRFAERTGLLQPQQLNSTSAVASFTNQALGIDAGQNRPGAGYADFWKSVIPPTLPKAIPPKLAPGAAGPGGPPAGMSALAAMGVPYLSTLARAAFSPWGAAIAGASVGLLAFKKAVRETAEAAERARQLYAKALSSGGLPLGFVAQRSNLARIIGVGEREVYQYGAAVGYLNEKLQWASKIQTETALPLTALAWEWKVVKLNIESAFSSLAMEAVPALQAFAEELRKLIEIVPEGVRSARSAASATPAGRAVGAVGSVFGMIGSVIGARQGGAKWGEAFGHAWKEFRDPTPDVVRQAPPVTAWSNRMQMSAWERMGLVLGQAGSSNYAQQTASNTREMVSLLRTIASASGTARSGWGATANSF